MDTSDASDTAPEPRPTVHHTSQTPIDPTTGLSSDNICAVDDNAPPTPSKIGAAVYVAGTAKVWVYPSQRAVLAAQLAGPDRLVVDIATDHDAALSVEDDGSVGIRNTTYSTSAQAADHLTRLAAVYRHLLADEARRSRVTSAQVNALAVACGYELPLDSTDERMFRRRVAAVLDATPAPASAQDAS